jgi:RNA polymerase sigma-70 factor, ECF subfamily
VYRFEAALPFMFRSRPSPQVAPLNSAGLGESERQLWQRVAEGDVLALRDVYRAHHTQVRAFAQRLLGDTAAAEDLVQDVFIAVPKAARRYRFETTPSSYLLGIAANCASKHIRASKRRRAASERFSQVPLAPVSTPDDEAHAARLVDQLMRAVDQLPDKLRIVFVLCQIEERDATEVGAILDLPSSTVRARLRAAREHLQRQDPWASAGENE